MKKTLAAIAASIVTASMAAGPFDGIYQSTTASNLYLSVHQNSSSIIVAAFATIPPTGHDYTENGYRFQPQRSDIWDLFSGVIGGNIAATTGESGYGSCLETGTFTFDGSGVTYKLSAAVATAAGRAQGFQCIRQPGSQARFNRVF